MNEWLKKKKKSKKYCYGLDSDLPNVDFLLLQGKIIMTLYYIKGSNWQFANVENWSYFEQSSHIYPSWPTECLLWENWPSYKSTTLYQHCINITIGIDHDRVCAGVVGTAIRNSTSCAGRRAAAPAGTTSAVPDCSTNHDSADRISGQFLFYHDHNLQKVRETCVFDVLYRCSSPSAFA